MIATTSGTKEEDKLSSTAVRYCRRFSLAEIQLATQDFSETHLIGHGGFGKVYKGQIDSEQLTVAIKRLAPNSSQGEGEFLTEIETLSKLRHVNLVSLIGYCSENGEMILVYEYIPRGTLADHLYKLSRTSERHDSSSLTWKQSLNICIGAGRGIDYLHTGSSIIHRDVKSTNILLDENCTAKVSDFGLAKHLSTSNSKSHVTTIVKGSFGYLDPSYFITCRLTQKSDTYAFGVVLLEVLCGRPAVDPRLGEDEMSLVFWAQEKISKRKAEKIVATNLRDAISSNCLKTFVGIATRCLNHEPEKRPTMAQVVVQLEFALQQQDRKALPYNASRFLPFWDRAKPPGRRATGSTEKDHKQGDVHTLSTAITAAQEEALEDQHTVVPIISIHELKDITDNFSSKFSIGKGSNGDFYRGALKSGQVAAIKKLRRGYRSPEKEFLEQVSMVSNLKHENVAQLLGYCVDGWQQFLVYEFAPNGSLHDCLHGQQGANGSKPVPALSWSQRVKIAMDAAKGLEYLHKRAQIHSNLKSSNILLFDDYQVAKLVDFGWSTESTGDRQVDCGDYHPFVQLLDCHPSELSGDQVSWKSDVYSFGVVLVELLTGRKVIDHTRPRGQQLLVEWAKPKLNKYKVKEIVDARMNGDYPPKSVAKMAKIAIVCMQLVDEFRPDMSMVISDLYRLLDDRETRNV